MSQKFYWDKDKSTFVPEDEFWRKKAAEYADGRSDAVKGPMILRDIEPYQSAITGEMIHGRRQHRDHLKAHKCIEVGNENVRQSPKWDVGGRVQDIKQAMEKHGVD